MQAKPSIATQPGSRPRRRWWSTPRGLLVLALIGVALVTAVAIPLYAMSRMMGAQPAAQLASAQPGTQVDVALEVTKASAGGPLVALVLEPAGGAVFQRTARTVRVIWDSDTKVVMGTPDEVRTGAVVQVHAVVVNAGELAADRIAVLSGYAEVR